MSFRSVGGARVQAPADETASAIPRTQGTFGASYSLGHSPAPRQVLGGPEGDHGLQAHLTNYASDSSLASQHSTKAMEEVSPLLRGGKQHGLSTADSASSITQRAGPAVRERVAVPKVVLPQNQGGVGPSRKPSTRTKTLMKKMESLGKVQPLYPFRKQSRLKAALRSSEVTKNTSLLSQVRLGLGASCLGAVSFQPRAFT